MPFHDLDESLLPKGASDAYNELKDKCECDGTWQRFDWSPEPPSFSESHHQPPFVSDHFGLRYRGGNCHSDIPTSASMLSISMMTAPGSLYNGIGKAKASHGNARSLKEHVKRPMNAFMVWAQEQRREYKKLHPKEHNAAISKALGERWQQLPEADKESFKTRAKQLKQEHLLSNPGYKYQPRRKPSKRLVAKISSSSMASIEYDKQSMNTPATGVLQAPMAYEALETISPTMAPASPMMMDISDNFLPNYMRELELLDQGASPERLFYEQLEFELSAVVGLSPPTHVDFPAFPSLSPTSDNSDITNCSVSSSLVLDSLDSLESLLDGSFSPVNNAEMAPGVTQDCDDAAQTTILQIFDQKAPTPTAASVYSYMTQLLQ